MNSDMNRKTMLLAILVLQGNLLNIFSNVASTFGQIKFLELFSYTSGITPLQNLRGNPGILYFHQ